MNLSMSDSPKRRDIIDATKSLLWSVGFESMSPRAIMDASGAGQGSLYHHFAGKKAVALEALSEVSTEMRADLARVFDQRLAPLTRIRRYLALDRQGLGGCRLGRLANEASFSDATLRGPMDEYFRQALGLVEAALSEAVAAGALPKSMNAPRIAKTIVSSVQGGYVLSRALNDPSAVNDATAGASALLEHLARGMR